MNPIYLRRFKMMQSNKISISYYFIYVIRDKETVVVLGRIKLFAYAAALSYSLRLCLPSSTDVEYSTRTSSSNSDIRYYRQP